MSLKPADKMKIAAAGLLLVILTLGVLIVWLELSPDAGLDAIVPPASTTQPSIQKSEFPRFLSVVQSDDIKQAAAMLAADPSLAKEIRKKDGATALHLAISIPMAKLLLDNGADINAQKTPTSGTPLRWAANRLQDRKPQTREFVQFLQSRGGSEPDIYLATAVGDIPQVKKLLATDPSILDKSSRSDDMLLDSCSPLQIAAYADQLDAAKFLIDQGANVRNRGGWHNTEAVEKAAWIGGADVVALLLDHGASVNGPAGSNVMDSPLYNAATMGHADVVKILLARGATFPRRLIPDVRTAMQHPGDWGPTPGTPEEFKEVLKMLGEAASTRPGMH